MSTSLRTRLIAFGAAALLSAAPLAEHASAAHALPPRCSDPNTPLCTPPPPDPPPPADPPCAERVSSTDLPDDSGDANQFHVLYVIPNGAVGRGAEARRSIQSQIVQAEALITRQDPTKMIRFDWISRQLEPRKCLDISTLHTDLRPTDITSADVVHDQIVTAWNGPGQYNPRKSYLVFIEGTGLKGGSGGVQYDTDGMSNRLDTSVVDLTRERDGAVVALHEVLHSLGAVSDSAAHHTTDGTGHVTDDPHDVMFMHSGQVYDDATLDSDHQDYWSTDPRTGGVLGEPRVIDFGPGPDTSPPAFLDSSPDAAALSIEPDASGTPYRVEFPAAWDDRAVKDYEIGVRQLTLGDSGDPVRPPHTIGTAVVPEVAGLVVAFATADQDVEPGASYAYDITAVDAAGNRSTTRTYTVAVPSARVASFSYAPILQSGGEIKPELPVTSPSPYSYRFLWRTAEQPADGRCSAHLDPKSTHPTPCPVFPGLTVDRVTGVIKGIAPVGIPPTGYAVDMVQGGVLVATAQVVIGDPSPPSSRDAFSYDQRVPDTTDAYTDVYALKAGDSTDIKPTVVVDHDPGTSYEVTDGTLPAGASIDPKTGTISVTNAAVGTTRLTVSQHSPVIWWFDRTATVTLSVS